MRRPSRARSPDSPDASDERAAVGPPLTALESRAAIAIGVCATLEALSMGAATGLAGLLLQPRHLRAITITATLALAACDLGAGYASRFCVVLIRTLAGAPEGILLWVCVGMIARTRTPEHWAALTCKFIK